MSEAYLRGQLSAFAMLITHFCADRILGTRDPLSNLQALVAKMLRDIDQGETVTDSPNAVSDELRHETRNAMQFLLRQVAAEVNARHGAAPKG